MYDLVLRNGFIVDGTGRPGFVGDVAVRGDRIVAVGAVEGEGTEEIDCTGLLVTPGWVDMHTHYDGQATWDPYLTPSGWHGCTTVVMGNCGVGFAPVREEDRRWLINVMEGVEDIPGSALSEGIQWAWETFPEYLDALERKPFALDVATQVPHSAVRGFVMGRHRSEREDASPEEIAEMKAIVEEGLRAGALGFSTSRTPLHKTKAGQLVAGTKAPLEELFGIAEAISEAGHGVFEIANEHVKNRVDVGWMKELASKTGQPVVFNLSQIDEDPTLYRELLDELEKAEAEGVELYAQSAGRAIGILMGWHGTAHPFALYPSWLMMQALPWEEKLQMLQDPSFKEKLLAETGVTVGPFETFVTTSFDKMFVLGPDNDYEPVPESSIAARAEREGRDPRDLAFDELMKNDGTAMLYFPLFNYSTGSLDATYEMHAHERTRMGLSDGGAHCGAICDGGMPTFMLTHWARDRKRGPTLPLERIVKRQTSETAAFYGLNDRGVVGAGYLADLNVIDFEHLDVDAPQMVTDLPAGGRRLVQRARGYKATIKSGEIILRDGEITGALPGRLLRGHQAAPAEAVAPQPTSRHATP